ncbi:bifunctional 2-methylcitrate dehydratase/aconitate hydratase [Chlamydiales bacterium]|nr:bifunctional 2-methylcitrate dehydratase/aconitate hydratase [Chlamydiales bacterium]
MVDKPIYEMANYLINPPNFSKGAYQSARLCLADSIGCAILALNFPACTKLLGPIIPHTEVPNGCHVPGVKESLNPIEAAFQWGVLIRWLDFNDTWLAKEWGHPSDNIGTILAIAEMKNLTMKQVLEAIIQAYEMQGVLALSLSCNQLGFDHTFFVKIASAGIAAKLLGGTFNQIADALSQAWIDGAPLRTYRHGKTTGSRKSWAAGDAASRGLFLAHLTMKGEKGYGEALFIKPWGVQSLFFKEQPIKLARSLDEYVIDHILFKVLYPAEFHAQTAVEAALKLHPLIKDRIHEIDSIQIETHDSALKIIDKTGPLRSPADRDHCLQYMVAVALVFGRLTADDYEETVASDSRIDILREKMTLVESPQYSKDYHLEEKRSIANSIQIFFLDQTATEKVSIEYPIGHKFRREEALPHLMEKLKQNLLTIYPEEKAEEIFTLLQNQEDLENTPVKFFTQEVLLHKLQAPLS